MATGQQQSGGVFSWPDVPALGPATWGEMSGVRPDSPLVGGRGVPTGGIDPDFKYRRVAVGAPPSAAAVGAPGHFTELMNLKHNPLPWVLLAAIAYLGLVHLQAGARIGRTSVRARVGK